MKRSPTFGATRRLRRPSTSTDTLQVTTNLEVALRYLRLRKKDRVLWIDAVVVNQLDLAERAQQVGLMADIYSKAASVRIWLGPADADTAVIFNYIRKKRLKKLYSLKVAWDFRGLLLEFWSGQQGSLCGSRRMYQFREIFLSPQLYGVRYQLRRFMPPAIAALLSLQVVRRDWFSRRWCIQELALSENAVIQCGSESAQSIDLHYLFDCSVFRYLTSPENDDFAKLRSKIEAITRSTYLVGPLYDGNKRSLTALLFDFRHWRNEDPKDTVYGLLAIADVKESSIIIDYTKSGIDVLIDVFNDALHYEKNIDLVGVPWAPNITGLPSWIVPTEDDSRWKNEEATPWELPDPSFASRIPWEWRTNARIVHRNEDVLSPLAFPSYILYADGKTLERYGEPPEFTYDETLNYLIAWDIAFSQFEVFTRTAREKSKTTRKPGDRVVVLFSCNHVLVLRPVGAGFILVEV